MKEYLGEDLVDDVIGGSLFNDLIIGLSGNDILFGHNGDDILDGGDGNDVLSGGIGDDLMTGGAGRDVFDLTAGDDVAFGGDGNDVFIVNGFAGDHVVITDTSGRADMLNFCGGITGARINLNPGTISTVDDRTIELTGLSDDGVRPLEMVLLQDLSGSFGDDVSVVQGLADDLIASLSGLATTVRLGLASFIDKPTSPFGSSTDHEYRTELGLTGDFSAWNDAIDALTIGSGNDGPESQITGLMQTALRTAEIGWSSDALKVVVLTTDARPHMAGDNPVAPNNGDDILDGPGNDGTGEDYPTIAQLKDALLTGGVIPVFAVTSSVVSDYQAIVDELGFGVVVELSSDSSDIIDAIEGGISDATDTLIENVIGTDFRDIIEGNSAGNMIKAKAGNDVIRGAGGKDEIHGNLGKDKIFGGNGDDMIIGGGGNDKLFGGAGADMFVFDMTGPLGFDRIMDFEDGIDMISIMDTVAHDILDVGLRAAGSDVIIDVLGTDIARIKNIDVTDLDSSDFIFGIA